MAGVSGPVHASMTLTQGPLTETSTGLGGGSFRFDFQQFAPDLGTLTGVIISDQFNTSVTGQVTNAGNDRATVGLFRGFSRPYDGDNQADLGVYNVGPHQTVSFSATNPAYENHYFLDLTAPAYSGSDSGFVGNGQVHLKTSYGGVQQDFPIGPLSVSSSSVSVTESVTYIYTSSPAAVPEPSTIVMAATGGVAALVVAWRRRTRTAA